MASGRGGHRTTHGQRGGAGAGTAIIENEFAILTLRPLMHPTSEPHPPRRASLLMQGAGQRLAVAGVLLALLWAAVAWALQGANA